MRVVLCGKVGIDGTGDDGRRFVAVGRPQVQLCLAALVLERHRGVSREELAHALWGDELGPHWRGALRGVLSKLRAVLDAAGLDDAALVAGPGGLVRLDLGSDVEVDTEQARRRLNDAESALAAGDAAAAADLAREAVALVADGFLPAVDRPWSDARRLEVARVATAARRLAGRSLLDTDPEAAVALLGPVVDDDPFDEATLALLLRALVAAGDRARAVAAYDRHVRLLDSELGVSPCAALGRIGAQLAGAARAGDALGRTETGAPAAPVRRSVRAPFVGREEATAWLRGLAAEVTQRPGPVVAVVEGEPGVGKTRLVREAALEHALEGGAVLWGRCSVHGELPFEPLVGGLERALAERPEVVEDLGPARPALASILPSLDAGGATRPDRDRVFAAVVDAVRRLADRPLLWVIDDLQWATADTLALVEHVARALDDRPVTLVATCRERPAPVATVLESLGRHGTLHTRRLPGLSDVAVARWLAEVDLDAPIELAEELCRRTGGNALFVGHLIDAAAAQGGRIDPGAVPPALAALLAQRLDALDPDADLLLATVAVLDDLASLELVAEVSGLDGPPLLSACDRATSIGLLEEASTELRFGHALVADAVLEHLGGARRSWLHARAASALERRSARRGVAAELARHHAGAGPDHRAEARRWSMVAAVEALDQVAWGVAAEHARFVLDEPAADPDERAGALVVLGRALRGLGDGPAGEDALGQAVDLARVHRLPRRMGEATLALVGGGGRGAADPARLRWVPLLEEALAVLADEPECDDLRSQLLGALAVALLLTDRDDERVRSGSAALAAARRSGDPAITARILLDHRYCLDPVDLERRLAELHEALALADAAGLPEVTAAALVYLHEDHLVAGRRDEARAALERAAAHLDLHPDAYWSWAVGTWRVVDRLLDGDLERAEVLAAETAGTAPDAAVGMACFGVNLVAVRAFQDRIDEVIDLLRRATEDHPWIPCYRAVLAFALTESGRDAEAARELGWFAADDFESIGHDTNRGLTLAMLSEVAVALTDAAAAAALRPLIEPYDGTYVVLNCYGGGGTVWGPAAAQLAALDRLLGDEASADEGDSRALDQCRSIGDASFAGRLGFALA